MKNDACYLTPVGVVSLCVEKTRIGNSVLLVVCCQGGLVRRRICNFDIELRHYRNSYELRSFVEANPGCTKANTRLPKFRTMQCELPPMTESACQAGHTPLPV